MPDNQGQSNLSEEELNVSLPQGKSITPQRPVNREATAAQIAKIIVWTFALSFAACFLVTSVQVFFFFYHPNNNSTDLTLTASFELFKTFSAVMSGPLGFVLGFYFRDSSKD